MNPDTKVCDFSGTQTHCNMVCNPEDVNKRRREYDDATKRGKSVEKPIKHPSGIARRYGDNVGMAGRSDVAK